MEVLKACNLPTSLVRLAKDGAYAVSGTVKDMLQNLKNSEKT